MARERDDNHQIYFENPNKAILWTLNELIENEAKKPFWEKRDNRYKSAANNFENGNKDKAKIIIAQKHEEAKKEVLNSRQTKILTNLRLQSNISFSEPENRERYYNNLRKLISEPYDVYEERQLLENLSTLAPKVFPQKIK